MIVLNRNIQCVCLHNHTMVNMAVSAEHSRTGLLLEKTLCPLPFCSWLGDWEQGGWSVSFSGDASKLFCRASATFCLGHYQILRTKLFSELLYKMLFKKIITHCFSSDQNCCQKHFRFELYS